MASALKSYRWLLATTAIIMVVPAYSYLDGNSGSIIVQALIGGVAGILAIFKFYWHQFKNFILRLFGKTPKEPTPLEPTETKPTNPSSEEPPKKP